MGPSRARDQKLAQDDVKALLREKDDRIAILETRLEAYSARASTAQTRLLKTIDVLDALRSQHALEISAEEQAKMKLVQDVNRWRSVAKNLEVEKDELKDVVEDLINKGMSKTLLFPQVTPKHSILWHGPYDVPPSIGLSVQVSNEWSSWPCSRMHITKHAEQVAVGAIDGGGTKDDRNDDLLTYATSIIARLRMELDVERQSHSRSVEEANLRTEELEAKVAVREAELENCITSPGDDERHPGELQNIPTHVFEKQDLGTRLPEPKPLSDEECLRFLEGNGARNRSLEIEIRQIAERLEKARMAASTSSGFRKEPQSPTLRNDYKAIPTPSPRTRSASVDPNALSRPLDADKAISIPATASPSTMLSIAQLDNQIRTMTTQMDALVTERTTLIESAARQRRVTDGINMDTFQDVLRVEGECVRLQAEVDDLREQLQHARASARVREKALLREVARLQVTSSSSTVLRPPQDLHNIFSAQPLEDDIVTDESMELASPLMPTIVLNPLPVHPSYNLDTDADLVSFPFSPRRVSSPAPEAPLTPPPTTGRSPGPQDIERVQATLDVARTLLAQKEEALTQLRAEMERLQQEVQARTRSDEDGDGG
ncbi:hypothetical protein OG21DRAFT_316188 [Imleria badia]|nr:hypothetical protein OG21DRAFT_316188 [Imleria badia]